MRCNVADVVFFFLSLSLSFPPLLLFQLESASQSPPTSAVSHTLYGDSSTSSPAVVCVTRCDLTNQPPHPSDTHTILPSSLPGVMEAFVKQRNVASLQKITAFWVTGPPESGIVHGKKQGTQKLCWIISACEVESKCFFIVSQNCYLFFFFFHFFEKIIR